MKLKILLILTFPFFVLENVIKAFSFQYMYDQGINSPNFTLNRVFQIFVIVIFVLLITYIGSFIYEVVKSYIIERKVKHIRVSLLNYFLNDYHHTKKKDTSYYLNIFSNDLKLLEENHYQSYFSLLENIVIFVASSISVFMINPMMLFCILLTFIPVFIIPKVMAKSLNNKTNAYSNQNSQMLKKINEYIEGIDVIYQYKITTKIMKKGKEVFDYVYKAMTNLQVFKHISAYLVGICLNITFVLEILLGLYFHSQNIITIGELTAIIQLSNTIINPVSSIADNLNQIQSVKDIKNKINAYISSKIPEKTISTQQQGIFIDHLSYQINERKIFDNLHLTICEQDHILLEGENGSGKSTLCKIISNRLNEYEGKIVVNYDELIYVDQDGFIFDESILYNITLGYSYSDMEIKNVLEKCELKELVAIKGLDFVCGENGNHLSGGEKQKIVLARALLQDKKIYILDESLSAIDKDSRKRIENVIFSQSEKTFVYISHFANQDIQHLFNKKIVVNKGNLIQYDL